MADSAPNARHAAIESGRVRVFLERAQGILLDDNAFSGDGQAKLQAIAREVGLTPGEYADVLEDLQSRQVIAPKEIVFIDEMTEEEGPASAGTSGPGTQGQTTRPPKDGGATDERVRDYLLRARGIIVENGGINDKSRTALFELSERMGLSESQVHAAIVSLRDTIQRAQTRKTPVVAEPVTDKPPPLPNLPNAPIAEGPPPQVTDDPLEAFLARAESIMVEHGGFNPRSQMLLAAAAQDAGLSEDGYKAAFDRLRSRFAGQDGDDPVADVDEPDRQRWSTDASGEPPPPPPKSEEKPAQPVVPPAERFGQWLDEELKARRDERLTRGMYKGWIRHAEHEFRLDRVYARHLIDDEIVNRGFVVAKNDQDDDDPRVVEFLDHAASILAEHRGINAKSRVLLNALAQRCGLSVEEMDRAIGAQETENKDEKRLKERVHSFRQSLQGALQQLDNSLLNARIEGKLVEQGELKFGIPAAQVDPIIREAATTAGVQRITNQQAEEHLLTLLHDQLGRKLFIANDVRKRMMVEGNQWGLKPDQVEKVIAEAINQNRKSTRNRKRIVAALVTLILLTATCIGAVLLNDSMSKKESVEGGDEAVDGEQQPATKKKSTTSSSSDPLKARQWWNKPMHILHAKAWRKLSKLRDALRDMDAKNVVDRSKAYRTLVKAGADEENRSDNMLAELICNSFALDPSEICAKAIADELVSAVPDIKAETKAPVRIFYASWATRTAALAIGVRSIPGDRARLLSSRFSNSLGTTMSSSGIGDVRDKKWVTALLRLLYGRLAAVANARPTWVIARLAETSTVASKFLERGVQLSLEAKVLAALVPHLADNWAPLRPMMKDIVEDTNPQSVMVLLESFERLSDSPLRDYLGRLFIARLGDMPNVSDLSELGPLVRKKLGISTLPSTRWRSYAEKLDEQSARLKPNPSEVELLQDIVSLAHLSLLGAALSKGDAGSMRFLELADQEAIKIVADRGVTKGRDPLAKNMTPGPLRSVQNTINRLRSSKNRRRIVAAQMAALASQARHVKNIDGQHAAKLADFVLSDKRQEVHDVVMNHLDPLVNWASLRVAIADELTDVPRLGKKQLEQLLSKLLKKNVQVKDDEAWRLSIRAALIESALAQLGSQRASRDGRMYDQTQQALTEHQREQAALFEVRSGDVAKATTPSQIQRLLIEQVSDAVSKGKLSSNDRKWVSDLPHRMVAIEYLATNDMQETVMLQQIWMRLLKTSMLQAKPDRSAEADEILAELQKKNRKAKGALQQLRNGQLAIVNIWKVWNRPMNE